MQTYKISTLGENFIFVNRGIRDLADPIPDIKGSFADGCHTVLIEPDMRFDYRVYGGNEDGIFLPDLARAVLIFLYIAKGLPKSEYEILYDFEKYPRITSYGKLGGNVGKCKLLFSKNRENGEKCNVEFHCVEAPRGSYAFIVCEKPDAFDMKKVISGALAECGSAARLRGAAALAFAGEEFALGFHSFDNRKMPDTSAYAAAAFLLSELFGKSEAVISAKHIKAHCTVDCGAVSVYDLSPTLTRIT